MIIISENRTSEIIHERYNPSYAEEWNGIVLNITQNRDLIVMQLKGQRDSRYFMDSHNYDYDPYSILPVLFP